MGTKETSSGFKGEEDKGERLRVMGEGDSALTHGALDKDCDAEVFWASMVAVSADCWAADLRSR
jgi:hypothetical protein